MKAEKFNYTATETMHYHCPCCAAEWQTNKLPYCPNCEVKIQYAATHQEGGECYVEGDWAAYNWLDDEGNDDWKIGRIVKVNNRLMYFNDDGTERSGYMPIYPGVQLLNKKPLPQISEGEMQKMWEKEIDPETSSNECFFHYTDDLIFKAGIKAAITQLMKGGEVKQNKGYHYDGDTSSTPTTNESKQ